MELEVAMYMCVHGHKMHVARHVHVNVFIDLCVYIHAHVHVGLHPFK